MVWTPKVNAFDATRVKTNLEAYFRANQAAALAWANGGVALPDIKDFHHSPKLVTVFPALTFLQTSHRSTYEDLLEIDPFEMLMELAIIHGNQQTLSDRSPKYSMAIESMVVNMPATILLANSIIAPPAFTTGTEITFNVQGKYKNQYIQVFQLRCAWKITTGAYA